jgi:hypothetical protein
MDNRGASGAAQGSLQSSDLSLASGTVIGLFDAAAIRISMRNREKSLSFLLSQRICDVQTKPGLDEHIPVHLSDYETEIAVAALRDLVR